ncbi:hypothetical protein J6Z39_01170 [bacterium]|nr:hypothetical protein [bacterium]MBP5434410.1 hypothetical protein [bacterium]
MDISPAFYNTGLIVNDTVDALRTAAGFGFRGIGKPVAFPLPIQRGLSEFHIQHHLTGTTGAWMDALKGPNHRIFSGHHLIEDGISVIRDPNLKFGDFLHHLGCDFLSVKGVPVVPKFMINGLLATGLSETYVSSLCSLNLAQVVNGGISLVCSGVDVVMVLTDAIPHTLSAAGMHFALGCFDLAGGLMFPNILMLGASAGEFFTSAVTLYRAVTDPVIPMLGVPGSVFYPALFQAMLTGGLIGGAVSVLRGSSVGETAKIVSCSTLSSAAATFTNFAVGSFAASACSGVATFFIAKKLLDTLFPSQEKPFFTDPDSYEEGDLLSPSIHSAPGGFSMPSVFSVPSEFSKTSALSTIGRDSFHDAEFDMESAFAGLKREPLGYIENDIFYPNVQGLRNAF